MPIPSVVCKGSEEGALPHPARSARTKETDQHLHGRGRRFAEVEIAETVRPEHELLRARRPCRVGRGRRAARICRDLTRGCPGCRGV